MSELPAMAVTIHGRPSGSSHDGKYPAKLELTVWKHRNPTSHPTVVSRHLVNLWGDGDIMAHNFAIGGDKTLRGVLADWIDENSEQFLLPREYKPHLGNLLRRGHRWPPEPPMQMSRRRFAKPFTTPAKSITRTEDREVPSPTWMKPGRSSVDPNLKEIKAVKGNKALHPSLHATRLAVVLNEVKNRFGKKDPELARLADDGLRGVGNIGHDKDVYTQIRDRLYNHGKARPTAFNFSGEEISRMSQLAHGYNWHRVGKGLQLDEMVSDYVNKIANDRLKSQSSQMRAAHNLFGIGWDKRAKPASVEARNTFLSGLAAHVRSKGVGGDSIYGMKSPDVNEKMILRSLRRLGQAEEQAEQLRKASPTSKISAIDPEKPAWSNTKAGVRVSPRARAGQYSRAMVLKYGVKEIMNWLRPREEVKRTDGIAYTTHPEGRYSAENHLGVNAEYGAARHALQALGLVPNRRPEMTRQIYDRQVQELVNRFVAYAREHVHNNPRDPLSRFYMNRAEKLAVPHEGTVHKENPEIGFLDLSTGLAPLFRQIAEDKGLRPIRAMVSPDQREDSNYPELPPEPGEENLIDLLDNHPHEERYWKEGETPIMHVVKPRGPFGHGKPLYEVVDDDPQLSEQDFNFDMPNVEGLDPTNDPTIQEIERTRKRPVRKPQLEPDKKKEVYQDIANHRKQSALSGKPSTRQSTVQMLMDKHGFDQGVADKHLENFNKLRSRPEGTVEPPPSAPKGKRKVRRFGRAPVGPEMQEFLKGGHNDGIFDPNNTTDSIFADWLQDHDDPRHMIVRRDLEHRRDMDQNNRDHNEAFVNHIDSVLGTTDHWGISTEKHSIDEISHGYNSSNGLKISKQPKGFRIIWDAPFSNTYVGAMTPEETKKIVDGLGLKSKFFEQEPEKLSRRRFARPNRVNLNIGDHLYTFTQEPGVGWRVVRQGSPTRNFSQNYVVQTGEGGNPVSCSCPDYFYRGRICKHMQKVAEINSAMTGEELPGEYQPREEPEKKEITDNEPEPSNEEMLDFGMDAMYPEKQGRRFSRNQIYGGKGDKLYDKDVDPEQLAMGIKIEMEHTDDANLAREIAMDHLAEDAQYYTKLKKVEKHSRRRYARRQLQPHPNHMYDYGVVNPQHRTDTVMNLAKQVYGDPAGQFPTGDIHIAPILADALEDAGCTDYKALKALRDKDETSYWPVWGDAIHALAYPDHYHDARWKQHLEDERQRKSRRRKYAAYRAPAGGIVARGTYYAGGEMVPDMTSEFMNPKKEERGEKDKPLVVSFNAKKIAALRHKWNMRVKKMPGAGSLADGTSAPFSGEKKTKITT